MKRSLTKNEILRGKGSFKEVFSSAYVKTDGLKLFYKRTEPDLRMFAVSLTRKYGNAVERNRAKRQVREIYRKIKHRISKGYKLIFVLYPDDYSYLDREKQIMFALRKAGLLNSDTVYI
jgi:ribonuclease P protein component